MSLTSAPSTEPILEPELPIVDPHHHLWFHNADSLEVWEQWASPPRTDDPEEAVYSELAVQILPFLRVNNRYLFDELLANLTCGHNFRATVFEESLTMYRASGPDEMRSVGEVEFANGIGAMSASGMFGEVKLALGIIGNIDLSIGAAAKPVIEAHLAAGGERYRGVRCDLPADPGSSDLSAGLELLSEFGLSWNIFVLEPQLKHVIDIARAHPQLPIVLEHAGGPVGIAAYAGQREQRFAVWSEKIRELSRCENVVVQLGGLGIPFTGSPAWMAAPQFSSEQLAAEWKPYIETSIEAFGAERAMFESDFPYTAGVCSYPVLWNAYKRIATGCSQAEKEALFSGTAARVFRLTV